MRCTILFLFLVGCSGVHMVLPAVDAGVRGDAAPAPDAYDYRASCQDVADAYEAARARFNCSYDWPACPRTLSNEQCITEFAGTVSCGHLDTIASRCSL